jgi:hypothetical protein
MTKRLDKKALGLRARVYSFRTSLWGAARISRGFVLYLGRYSVVVTRCEA